MWSRPNLALAIIATEVPRGHLTIIASVVALATLLNNARQAQALTCNPSPIVLAGAIHLVLLWPLVRPLSRLEHKSIARRQRPRRRHEPMSRKLRAAIAQMGPVHRADDRRSVVRRLLDMLREAHAAGARFVVFPELALTTFFPRYWMTDQAEIDRYFEREMPGPETRILFDTAKELGVGFYLGYAELTEEAGRTRRYNTSILVDPTGKLIGRYRKIHLPGHSEHLPRAPFQHLEKRYFDVGNEGFKVWRAFGGIVGMCICNDRRWPETFRVMGLQGVELVALGYNTPTENIHHDEPLHLRMFHHLVTMQANAYQNGTWILAAAKAGKEDGFGMIGGSCIVAPTGEIVAQAVTEADEVIAATCDLDFGTYIKRTIFNFEKHRRIEHYRLITERTGAVPPPEN